MTVKEAGCEKLPPALRKQCEKKQNEAKDKKDDKDDKDKKASLALRVVSRFQGSAKAIPERVVSRFLSRHAGLRSFKPLFTGDKIRVSWADHPGNQLLIEELPGKPVKRKVRRALVNTSWYVQAIHGGGGSAFLMSNILQDAKLSKGMSYEAAVSAMEKALDKAKATAQEESGDEYSDAWFKKTGWPTALIQEDDVSYLNVEPHDYKPIKIQGKDFAGTSEWNEFTFSADRDEKEDKSNNRR